MRLQVPQRRPRITGVPVRRDRAAGGAAQPDPGMAGPRQPVPLRLRVPPRAGDAGLDERITAGAGDRRARRRHRHSARGRRRAVGEKAAMLTEVFIRLAHARSSARLRGRDAPRPNAAALRCRCGTRTGSRSCARWRTAVSSATSGRRTCAASDSLRSTRGSSTCGTPSSESPRSSRAARRLPKYREESRSPEQPAEVESTPRSA